MCQVKKCKTFSPKRGRNRSAGLSPAICRVTIKAGFYSDVVECSNITQAAGVRFPAGSDDFFLHLLHLAINEKPS